MAWRYLQITPGSSLKVALTGLKPLQHPPHQTQRPGCSHARTASAVAVAEAGSKRVAFKA
jgi:hypothetical protein